MPTRSYRYDAFICYSSKDRDWVRARLLPYLERHGLRVCIDYRDFEIGAPSLVNMENAVKRSRKTLLVLTPNWIASEWTSFEALLIQARDPSGQRRRTLPLMVQSCSLPDRLQIFNHLDLTDPAEFDSQMQRLVQAIKSKARFAAPSGGDKRRRGKTALQPGIVPAGQGAAPTGAPAADALAFRLREVLDQRFSLEELKTLCFDLRVDYEDLGGEGKGGKARELVAYMQRHSNLQGLVAAIRRARRDISI